MHLPVPYKVSKKWNYATNGGSISYYSYFHKHTHTHMFLYAHVQVLHSGWLSVWKNCNQCNWNDGVSSADCLFGPWAFGIWRELWRCDALPRTIAALRAPRGHSGYHWFLPNQTNKVFIRYSLVLPYSTAVSTKHVNSADGLPTSTELGRNLRVATDSESPHNILGCGLQ